MGGCVNGVDRSKWFGELLGAPNLCLWHFGAVVPWARLELMLQGVTQAVCTRFLCCMCYSHSPSPLCNAVA